MPKPAAQAPKEKREIRISIDLIGVFLIVVFFAAIAVILYYDPGRNVDEGFIAFVALSTIAFLLGVARQPGTRNFAVALLFILTHIAAMILAFGSLYSKLGLKDAIRTVPPDHHTSIWDGIYFSIITWTTVGYGDLTPTLQTRSIAAFEALTGYVVMGLLISILVVMAQNGRRPARRTGSPAPPRRPGPAEPVLTNTVTQADADSPPPAL